MVGVVKRKLEETLITCTFYFLVTLLLIFFRLIFCDPKAAQTLKYFLQVHPTPLVLFLSIFVCHVASSSPCYYARVCEML